PATHEHPQTAATFRCLNFFMIQTHQAKTTMYDFIPRWSARHAGVGAGRLCMVREWRHLQMLKCTGRGHDPSGVNGT
ncbi:hypothetical protein C8F04DRAFT_984862, partial [Mycena alexandri]